MRVIFQAALSNPLILVVSYREEPSSLHCLTAHNALHKPNLSILAYTACQAWQSGNVLHFYLYICF